jgi:hypothetical protein
MLLLTNKVLLWIGSQRAMMMADEQGWCLHRVHFCGGGVRPPEQNGWATSPSKDRHTLLPKVKGRMEGVEDAVKEGASDSIPEHEVALANSRGGGTVGVESPSRVG